MHQMTVNDSVQPLQQWQIDFLLHIGAPVNKYFRKEINCELCGGSDFKLFRSNISIGRGKIGQMPIVICMSCTFLFQYPRFNDSFYADYYSIYYRNLLYGTGAPSAEFISDQELRGELLLKHLEAHFTPGHEKSVLDVGCSCGGMLNAFFDKGCDATGFDPDGAYIAAGIEKYSFSLFTSSAEEYSYPRSTFDVVLIMGSLEHVLDPNAVLRGVERSVRPGGLLVIEGRGLPQSKSEFYFNQNHHRYFSLKTIELFFNKYGFETLELTDQELTGPTRKGGIFGIGRYKGEKIGLSGDTVAESVEDVFRRFELSDFQA